MKLKRGTTSKLRLIFIADSSSTTGAGLANLTYNSAGLVAYYYANDLNNELQITLATMTLGTWASGGFVAVDNTNMPGWYQIGIPDAALDGGDEGCIQLRGATNMVPVNVYIELDAVDYQTDAFGALKPTTAGRTLDVSTGGEAGIDWANVGSPTTSLALTGTTIATTQKVDLETIKTNPVVNAGTLTFPANATLASSAEVTSIQNNTRTVIVVPAVIERPDSGTDTYLIHIYLYDEVGNMEAPDSAPTVTLTNAAGTDRSARLGSTTGTLVGTGHYKWVYTNTSTDTLEQLLWEFSVIEGGATRLFGRDTLLVDTTAVDFTSADRTVLQATATAAALADVQSDTNDIQNRLPAALTADGNIKADTLRVNGTAQTAGDLAALITAAASNVTTILGKFTGITLLAQWLGAMAGKQTPNSTALTEINATGAGSGTYSAVTDSQEALRDNYTTGGDTLVVSPVVATVVGNNIVSSGTTQAFRYTPLPSGPIVVLDSNDNPIDLSAAAVKMINVNTSTPSDTWTLTEATGLSVGGASNNQVSVDYLPTFHGKYKWWLYYQPSGETDWIVAGFGFWDIGDCADPR